MNRLLIALGFVVVVNGCKNGCDPPPPPPPPPTANLVEELDASLQRLGNISTGNLPTAIAGNVAIARLVLHAERLRFSNDVTDEAMRKAVARDIGYANGIAAVTDRTVKEHVRLTRAFVENAEETMALLPPQGTAPATCSAAPHEDLLKVARMERAVLEERPGDMTAAAIAALEVDGNEKITGALDTGLNLDALTPQQKTTLTQALGNSRVKGPDALAAYVRIRKELGPAGDPIARHVVQSPNWTMNADQLGKYIEGTLARSKKLKEHYRRPFTSYELAHVLVAGDDRNLAAKRTAWIATGEVDAKQTRGTADDALREQALKTASAIGPCLASAAKNDVRGLFSTWLAASGFLTQNVPCQGSPAICTADPTLGCTAATPSLCGERCGSQVCTPGNFCNGTACVRLGSGKQCTTEADCTGSAYTVGFNSDTLCDTSTTPGQCTGLGWRCELPAHCGPAQECNQRTNHCEPRATFVCSDSAPCKSGEGCVQQNGTNRCVPEAVVGKDCNPAFLADGRLAPADCAMGKLVGAGATLVCRADPKPETCNGRDQDCDFVVDNNLTDLTGCGSEGNVCTETAKFVCDNGQLQCVSGPPQNEVCNSKDDNCNGLTDEPPGCPPRCGDGRVDPPEECDDGNAVNGDGCENGCVKTPPSIVLRWDNVDDDAYAWIGGSNDPGQAICRSGGARSGSCDLGAELRSRLSSPVDTLVVLRIKNSHCGRTSGHFTLEQNGNQIWNGMQMDSGTAIHCEWTYKKWLHINPYVGVTRTDDKEMYCLWPTDQCWWEP